MKARDYKAFWKAMELRTNSSNNTVYADADGNIAYFHGNFIPKRDTRFDYTKPVDGSDPATEWGPVLAVEQSPHVRNPSTGWLYNTNNWPWTAAGDDSPDAADYPRYFDRFGDFLSDTTHHTVAHLEQRGHARSSPLSAAAATGLAFFSRAIRRSCSYSLVGRPFVSYS